MIHDIARHTIPLLLVLASSHLASADEGGWRNFFGLGENEQDVKSPMDDHQLMMGDPVVEQTPAEDDKAWMITSPFANVSWPEIKMPRFEFNAPWRNEDGQAGWFSESLAKARNTTRGAMMRTRSAWNGAIERMKFTLPGRGNDTQTQIVDGDQPGFWDRTRGPEQQPTETDDIVEMMAREQATLQR